MLNFSVPIRLPSWKIPKLPLSQTWPPPFLAFWSDALAPVNKLMAMVIARIVRIVAFTFLPPALLRREPSPLPLLLVQLSSLKFAHAVLPANKLPAFAGTTQQTLLPAWPTDGR